MPSGKAKLVDYMTLFPQTDILGYGNTEGQEPALSMGYDIQDYGHVYISAFGMAWIAEQFGYLSPKEYAKEVDRLISELEEAKATIVGLQEQIDQLPMAAERMMENVRNAAIAAVTDLGGLVGPRKGDSGEEAESDDDAPVEAAGGDNKASRKPRRTDV